MEILSSRVLLRPRDLERTRSFYAEVLELPIYREFAGGTVFFLGGGFLEVSGSSEAAGNEATQLWLQVRDVDAVHAHLRAERVPIDEAPVDEPWGLREMRARDPDGRRLVFVEVPPDHPL
ncbi:MAG: VOC family protein, partial [Actinobacteria bacterium]|nr:VOC family protein [Actinomycetota bacterium]NIS28971.1 VOC family protein [Actinomycetota bacterium]NIU64396.1 VOC family protein [Actinomycetota bacterium]NIW26202.1 VOC family protein [Actinomycetota bacterium]NIX18776.1 VOC family protein [Actinomycetota bacterium]